MDITTDHAHQWRLPASNRSEVASWFEKRAAAVDRRDVPAQDGLAYLAERQWLSKGIDERLGGDGGTTEEMVEVIATVASRCLTSAFVLWCHRMFLTYVVAGDNEALKETVLPDCLGVRRFGASGLANVMKYAASIESLSVTAEPDGTGGYIVSGSIPWASNLVSEQFIITVAAGTPDGGTVIAAIPSHLPGVHRNDEHPLIGLGGTVSTSLRFDDVALTPNWIVHTDGEAFLSSIRPTFLLLQSALAWGVSEAALSNALPRLTGARTVLNHRGQTLASRLRRLVTQLRRLSRKQTNRRDDRFLYDLLTVRRDLAQLVTEAVWLEIEATGGAGYVASSPTARRLRESAFFPIQSPSLVQLTVELSRLQQKSIADDRESDPPPQTSSWIAEGT